MDDERFKTLYERIVRSYELDLDTAKRLFWRILKILYGEDAGEEDSWS